MSQQDTKAATHDHLPVAGQPSHDHGHVHEHDACGCGHDHDHHHHHHFAPVTTIRREGPKVGRNDACPCGSGKKYKKCCMPG